MVENRKSGAPWGWCTSPSLDGWASWYGIYGRPGLGTPVSVVFVLGADLKPRSIFFLIFCLLYCLFLIFFFFFFLHTFAYKCTCRHVCKLVQILSGEDGLEMHTVLPRMSLLIVS